MSQRSAVTPPNTTPHIMPQKAERCGNRRWEPQRRTHEPRTLQSAEGGMSRVWAVSVQMIGTCDRLDGV
jgi:hypothetical protein